MCVFCFWVCVAWGRLFGLTGTHRSKNVDHFAYPLPFPLKVVFRQPHYLLGGAPALHGRVGLGEYRVAALYPEPLDRLPGRGRVLWVCRVAFVHVRL